MESSRARDWTRVPCFGRQILIHSSIREVLALCFEDSGLSSDSWNSPVALVFCVTQVLQENRTSRRLSIYLCIYLLSTMRSYMTVEAEKNHMICRLQLEWSQWYSSSSVQFSRSVMSDSLWPHEPQHARPPCPSPTPGVPPHPCPSSWWCYRAISSSVIPFSSCPQSLPASESFQVSQLFTSGGQSIGVSGSKSCTQCASTFWKFSPGYRTGKYQFWFKSQRKAMPKNGQTEAQLLHSSHMLVK